jgi:predicted secreted protein
MPATVGAIGYGVRFVRSTGNSPDNWENVGQIAEISGPSLGRDAIDASHSLSPSRYREFISGMREGGEVSFTILLAPSASVGADHKKLLSDYESNSAVTYRVIFPDAANTYWQFSGLITALDHEVPIDNKMTVKVKVKVSGQPTLAAGAYLPA